MHAVVVMVPLTALALLLAAFEPLRARLGVVLPLLGVGTLALVPLTTFAGRWLEERVFADDLVREHTRLGGTLLPWVAGLAALTVLVWVLDGASGMRRRGLGGVRLEDRRTRIALGALSAVVALGAVVTTVRIGESGSRAVWDGAFETAG